MLYLFLIVGCLSSLHWTFGNDLQSLASARQVLDLASNFIKEKIDTNTFDPLPVITMSYAQTLDGSM